MKKLILGFLLNIILLSNVLADEIETKKVISTGMGTTEAEALKDTTRNAVQQVVGSYILSETYVKNYQVIKDEIFSNSNGYVKTFKILSKSKEPNGLISIEAEVEVEPSKVSKKLGELNLALKNIVTTEFKAISLDKFQASKDFKNMFEKVILKPVLENKKIYDINVGELKSVDKLPAYLYFYSDSDQEKPFILSFSINFNHEYIENIKKFLEKSSKNKYDYKPNNYEKLNGYLVEFFGFLSGDKYSNSPLEFKTAYEIDENMRASYEKLIFSFYHYTPSLTIKFLDNNNELYKSIFYSSNGYGLSPLHEQDTTRLSLFKKDAEHSIFGIFSDFNLGFIDQQKNVELGIYLNEEDLSKIKKVSVEVRWDKK